MPHLVCLVASWALAQGVRTTGTERERSGQGPFDGMDLHGGWSASPSNGCTESGWKGDYSIFGGHQKILSVEIGPEKTTFTWSPEVASQAKQLNEQTKLGTWMRMEGPQLNQDLADFFCSPGWHASARLVTNACSFWSSLTSRCPALSAEPIDPESLPESAVTAVGLVDSAAEARLPDPFREVHLGGPWIPAPTNGCTSWGWEGEYWVKGHLFLAVKIRPTSTVFEWNPEMVARAKRSKKDNKLRDWWVMEGAHSNEEIAQFFCGSGWDELPGKWYSRGTALAATACTFWTSLDGLCPSLP